MTRWETGELVIDEDYLIVESSVPSGTYRIVSGLYRLDTIQNLSGSGAAETLPSHRLVLAEITVQ
jgi:hypothetical protein